MANKILVATNATPHVFAIAAYNGDGGAQTALLTLSELASGAARQSDKVDLDNGLVNNRWPKEYAVTVLMVWEQIDEPNAGERVDIYWAASLSNVAATANPGGVSGSDGAYTGTAGSTLTESLQELQFLGSLITTNDFDIVQQQTFFATLPTQYGTIVVVNNVGEHLTDEAGNKLAVVLTPREYEVQ